MSDNQAEPEDAPDSVPEAAESNGYDSRTKVVLAVVAALVIVVGVAAVLVKDSGDEEGIGSRDEFAEVVIDRIFDSCGISPTSDYVIDDELFLEEDDTINGPGGERWVVEIYLPAFDATAYMIVLRLDDGSFGDRVYDVGCP